MRNRRIIAFAVVLLAVGAAGCVGGPTTDGPTESPAPSEGTLEVHMINVGQAASTLIVGPEGDTMLIDTGDFRTDGEQVLEYLEAQNIDRIDYLVTSHPDADHIGGHANIITHYETQKDGIGAIYDPGLTSTTQTYARYLDAVEFPTFDRDELVALLKAKEDIREGRTTGAEEVRERFETDDP